MPTYKFVHTTSWSAYQEDWEEFDTGDQDKWDELLEKTSLDEDELNRFPKEAPQDPAIWFELYSSICEMDLENQGDDQTGDELQHDFGLYDDAGNWVEL